MELKKSPKADLEGKKAIFFEIGLALSLLLMIFAFSWSQSEMEIEILVDETPIMTIDELPPITKEPDEMPKPPSPKQSMNVSADVLKVVDDDTLVELDLSTVDFDDDVEQIFAGVANTAGSDGVGWNPEEVFYAVEDMPQFGNGGLDAFRDWVKKNVGYPERARQANISGTVILQFVVMSDGSLGDINVLASPSQILSDAVVETMRKAPKWKPGRQQGQPVRVSLSMPVEFNIR